MTERNSPRYFRTRGRFGATRRAVEGAVTGQQLAGSALVTAELARAAADLVDAARVQQDARLWLSASQRLQQLIGKLGLDAEPSPPAAGHEAGGELDSELAALLAGGPE